MADSPPLAPDPRSLAGLMTKLEGARKELKGLSVETLARAWAETVDAFLGDSGNDGAGEIREPGEDFRSQLAESSRLSRAGLEEALGVVLRGVRSTAALEIFEKAEPLVASGRPVLVILASNLPALAVQSLLPALALRRPLLIKSASAEPLFTPAFLRALARRIPAAGKAFAAASWPGGSRDIEDPLIAAAGRVVAYGGRETIEDLESRAGDKLVAFGPKISVGLIGREAEDLDTVAAGLARDIALFDQRGCLSVQAIITDGEALQLAGALGRALESFASRWPMGPDPAAASQARQARDEAIMRGAEVLDLPMSTGTVVVEPPLSVEPPNLVQPSPGRRFVRIYPVEDLAAARPLLEPWEGQIQGVAASGIEGHGEWVRELGASRIAPPGALQDVDVATWHNGGLAPLDAYL